MSLFLAKIAFRDESDRVGISSRLPAPLSPFNQLICASIGLLLTICGTFLEAHIIKIEPRALLSGIELQAINVNFQIGAIFLTGCLGGQNAGAIAQIAYLLTGLFFLPVFDRGGTIDYLQLPTFGYLIGFVPGAWLCGKLAYLSKAKLEILAFSSICGLVAVHCCGIGVLVVKSALNYFQDFQATLDLILQYSVYPLPGQLAVICAVTTIAFILRRIMFN